jgi:hypothetical protein
VGVGARAGKPELRRGVWVWVLGLESPSYGEGLGVEGSNRGIGRES